MKHSLLPAIFFLLLSAVCSAQTPQAISYQAVARDTSGILIVNQNISLRFTIHNASAGGTIVYRETQNVTTNSLGLFTVNVGLGTVVTGTFSTIAWSSGTKFLQVELDAAGGSSYVDMGTQQMLSVPYSLYSASSGTSAGAASGDLSGTYPGPTVARINGSPLGSTVGAFSGQVLKWNGSAWAFGADNNSGGTVTSITAGSGLTGGTITASGTITMPNVGTAGTFGSATLVPIITTDAQGRVSNISTTAVSSGWSLTGNSNTVDGTNFFGTTNNVALTFKVNNQKSGRIDFTNPNNNFLGYQCGLTVTTGRDNTAFGHLAFSTNTTGNENTAFGESALLNNVAAWGNTAIGYHSQYYAYSSTTQSFPYNTSVGHNSLQGSSNPANNTGTINTAIGGYSLYNNTSGSNNTGVGFQTLIFNTTGSINTAGGFNALYHNTTGFTNTAYGPSSLYSNTTGSNNIAIGNSALYSCVAGSFGVAIGDNSQYYAYNGPAWNNYNTSVGYYSLRGCCTPANNNGTNNTAMGAYVLQTNSSGSYNTGSGYEALSNNSTGNFNTAYGNSALLGNDVGTYNTATGYQALYYNTSGIYNAGSGNDALLHNGTGTNNAAFGSNTLSLTTASNYNTACGASAGAIRNNGSFNTFVGHAAYANADGYSNSTCIGDNTTMTASDQVRIGNGVTSIGGPQNWTNTSDRRIKLNIHDDVQGLSFIKLLKPVTYNKSLKLENQITGRENPRELEVGNNYEKIRYSGFIAQDVEQAAKEIGYDFSGVDAPKNEKDLYGLRYAEFVVPLVKAVQEQQAQIEKLNSDNEKLQAENAFIKTELEKINLLLGMEAKLAK